MKTEEEISVQLKLAVSFPEPKRTEHFNSILNTIINDTLKQNILIIKQRIDNAAISIDGYTQSEIEHYQNLFAKDFYFILHSKDYTIHIQDQIRELLFYSKGIEKDLSPKQYEFLEDRERDKADCIEAERYRIYLENLLLHFSLPHHSTTLKVDRSQNETYKLIATRLSTFQNNFDSVDVNVVYDHFKRGLVDKKYFTEAELKQYLKAAFETRQAPKQPFKFTNAPTKEKVMEVFYRYYRDVASKPHGKQLQYAALLGDYFAGYNTKTVSTNFSKTVY